MKRFNFLVFKGVFIPKMFHCHMKIMAHILAILTGYSLFLVICNAQPSVVNLQEQKLINNTSNVLRLAIPAFKKTGGDVRYNLLKRLLPEILAVSQIANDRIEYVDRGNFWIKASEHFLLDEIQQNNNLLYADEVLDALGIDLILRGNIFEYRGKIRIEAVLEDRRKRKNKPIKISSNATDIKGLYSEMLEFGKKINDAVLTLETEKKAKRIAFLCFRDDSAHPLEHNDWLKEDLAISLMSYLEPKKEIKFIPIPWSQTKEFCGEDTIDDAKILKKVEAEALLRGKFLIEGNNITVVPMLYVREKKFLKKDPTTLIELIEIKGNLNNYFDLEYSLAQDVGDILDAIIEDRGKWNIDTLRFSSDNPEDYVKKGKDYMGSKENKYLAALMFKKAIEIKTNYE